MNIRKYIIPIESYTRKNAPNILTGLGIAGVIGTAVSAVRDSKKAEKLICKRQEYKLDKYGEELTKTEKVIAATPAYLPTILTGLTTITCIYGSNHINKNRQAMLMSAYGYLNNCFTDYKDAVEELYGDGASNKVEQQVIETRNDKKNDTLGENEIVVYEPFSDEYITTTRDKIDIALHNINKHFYMFGALSINNFLDFLDVEEVPNGDLFGWSYHKNDICGASTWLDATLDKIVSPDEYPLYGINWNVLPTTDYIEWHLFK